jgi:hypothetical protein
MVFLDLSAAFDTIDHNLIIRTLYTRFHIRGTVLKWIKSYLDNRFFKVRIGNVESRPYPLKVGVPQGSILGPILFNCIMAGLAEELEHLQIEHHIYADDTQLLVPFTDATEVEARHRLKEAFDVISRFMMNNHLKLNADKTIFLPISRKVKHFDSLELNDSTRIPPSTEARNLGVTMTSDMSLDKHVCNVRRTCYSHLKNLSHLRMLIPSSMLHTLTHAYITSRIDFCNSLLAGSPDKLLSRLQVLQNSCARQLTNTHKREHITPVLRNLHWLPIKYRSLYKIAVLVRNAIYNEDYPEYITISRQENSEAH